MHRQLHYRQAFSPAIYAIISAILFLLPGFSAAEEIVLTQHEAVEKAKAFYDTKGEWAGKFTITKVHRVRFEQSGPQNITAHVKYQAGFLQDLTKTVEDQRTFEFLYQNGWKVTWMGGHKSARF